jgi:ubiquinone/menaquinone biosynthesis C-methylase UbiE
VAERPYLTFYGANGIIPVHQDIGDLDRHIARRRALYLQLGIHPLSLRKRTILEFGPGTGDNAVYLAACAPDLCVLVDGNPASIQAVSAKLESGVLPRDHFECTMSDIVEYTDSRRFDVVLCEGVLAGQDVPRTFLAHVASFAGEDGIVAITTTSPVSNLAEVCRRVLKVVLGATLTSQADLLEELTAFFAPDLNSLPGMSRGHADWVLDNIIHPWPARFSVTIPDVIAILGDEFDLLGTSPRFIQDWRWYKSIPGNAKTGNDLALEEYQRWGPYLIDYRIQPDAPLGSLSAPLETACAAAFDVHSAIWTDSGLQKIPDFVACLQQIRDIIHPALPGTAQSITDYLDGLSQLQAGARTAEFGSFRGWFGRGQQYVSFTRK